MVLPDPGPSRRSGTTGVSSSRPDARLQSEAAGEQHLTSSPSFSKLMSLSNITKPVMPGMLSASSQFQRNDREPMLNSYDEDQSPQYAGDLQNPQGGYRPARAQSMYLPPGMQQESAINSSDSQLGGMGFSKRRNKARSAAPAVRGRARNTWYN